MMRAEIQQQSLFQLPPRPMIGRATPMHSNSFRTNVVPAKMGFLDTLIGGGKSDTATDVNTVIATYNGKSVNAQKGARLRPIVDNKLRTGQSYSCENGECGVCELLVNGKRVRPCVAKVPAKDFTVKKTMW